MSGFELLWGICDENVDGKLNPNEVHQDNCLETLETMFGLTKSGLNELFLQIDVNADMLISLDEASMAVDRSITFNVQSFDLSGWEFWINTNGLNATEEVTIKWIVKSANNQADSSWADKNTFTREALKEYVYKATWSCIWSDIHCGLYQISATKLFFLRKTDWEVWVTCWMYDE